LIGVRLALAQRAALPYSKDQSRERRDRARFPHNKEKHRTLECAKCHEVTLAQPVVERSPGHNACVSCHNFAEMAVLDFSGYCGVCHAGLPAGKEDTKLFQFPKATRPGDFGIDFSHPRHAKPFEPPTAAPTGMIAPVALVQGAGSMATVRCSGCHFHAEKTSLESGPELSLASGHRYCYACHGATPVKQPSMNQCSGCHKLGLAVAPRIYGKVANFKHLDHEIDIRKRRKGEPVASGDGLCVTCHQSTANAERLAEIELPPLVSCGQCHTGGLGFPETLSASVQETLKE